MPRHILRASKAHTLAHNLNMLWIGRVVLNGIERTLRMMSDVDVAGSKDQVP